MIKNIPCKYSQEWLLEDVLAVCEGVDFLQMPLTRRGDMCMGYAFVNFRSADLAAKFLRDFQGSAWNKRPNSEKRADVSVANEQGFDANVQKFVSSEKKNTSRAQPYINRFGL
jgi:RNA recognition motif-containing protein